MFTNLVKHTVFHQTPKPTPSTSLFTQTSKRFFHPTPHQRTSPLVTRVNAVTMASPQQPKVTSLEDLPSTDAKWIKLQKATYTDAHGKSRIWEIASRKTTGSAGVDAVAMGNIIYHPSKPPSTIVVIQFRPPVGGFTVEWPAGLIDKDETPQQAAVRELYEETGYKGKVVSTSPAVAADPGMTSANLCLCMVEIQLNEGDPEPEQHLDEGEDIQRVNIPVSELYARLEEFAKEGYVIAAKLYHWAAGAQYAIEHPELFQKVAAGK